MAKDNVLVRKINGLETAGSLSILFSDKTGTITEGRLSVVEMATGNVRVFEELSKMPAVLAADIVTGIGVNNSAVSSNSQIIGGNSTDRALMSFLVDCKADKSMNKEEVRNFNAFDSAKKYSSVTLCHEGKSVTYIKGAPEKIIENCTHYVDENGNARIKTAIVFPFFQDFVTDGAAPLQQYSELLSHLWDEYSLNSNENICIFLAPQMDSSSLSRLFEHLSSGDIFRGRFFNENKTINRSCTMHIGLPNQDEFRYMLEYLRIVGEEGKRLRFVRKDIPKLVSSLMYLSREADREQNRAGYLSSVYENIVWYMKGQSSDTVVFNEDVIKRIYCRFKAVDSSDPSAASFWQVIRRICRVSINPTAVCARELRKYISRIILLRRCIGSLRCSVEREDSLSLMVSKNTTSLSLSRLHRPMRSFLELTRRSTVPAATMCSIKC